eukprot:NODE_7819_length_738_cov_34.421138_g7205_i0.p1 GENE.NODE_7819_length_738_cov_34.421138_g7205_i0~~NODE_7819_length_738_cov_34.421138_g7205_i0.p1  ORF type:complete len:169 (-),score=37.41 NODE_7819_length_738_cov_34.421138_g7205_i0:117-623(-)
MSRVKRSPHAYSSSASRHQRSSQSTTASSTPSTGSRSQSATSYYSLSSVNDLTPDVLIEHPVHEVNAAKAIQCAWNCFKDRSESPQVRALDYQCWKYRRRLAQEETMGRSVVMRMEVSEFIAIQLLEEEIFTRYYVCVIERAWCAYKTRRIINEIIRRKTQLNRSVCV